MLKTATVPFDQEIKTAGVFFDQRTQKWVAKFGQEMLAASANKQYVINMIEQGLCRRANRLGVTRAVEVRSNDHSDQSVPAVATEQTNFGINERFQFLQDFVEMVAQRVSASLIVAGEGGLGKTFTVNHTLKKLGLENSDDLVGFGSDDTISEEQSRKLYTVIKGYSTAKGLYRTLYENRNRLVVFDDCDSVLKDQTALMILKAALDSYDKRIIHWNADSFKDDGLPRSFEFLGSIIFISNLSIYKMDQAVRSRSLCVDVTMTTSQKLERMAAMVRSPEFMPQFDMDVKHQALEFLHKIGNRAPELTLRSLISVIKVAGRGDNWERRAEYLLLESR